MASDYGDLPTGAAKRARVREMFDTVAPRYDRVNALISFGLDQGWRRRTVKTLGLSAPALVADIGCGTGDLGRMLRSQGIEVVGLDMSMGMLRAGRPTAPSGVLADAAMLPLADRALDGAVSGFALRNFAELPAVIVELARVVRPAGRIALLEVAQPEHWLVRAGHSLWFNHAVPRIGSLLSDRAAYRYLPRSVAYLPSYEDLLSMLEDAGFSGVRRDLLSGGLVQVISARRDGSPRSARLEAARSQRAAAAGKDGA
ncbi:MAG: ubiquinone/menaquinone biosynthesis methyltransferase [Acidimicrobiales bacterium]